MINEIVYQKNVEDYGCEFVGTVLAREFKGAKTLKS